MFHKLDAGQRIWAKAGRSGFAAMLGRRIAPNEKTEWGRTGGSGFVPALSAAIKMA